ncbi:MAG: hypothetical protein ABSB94_07035 [Syntrophorhabdales bacterium]|jgi:hypothetical protein
MPYSILLVVKKPELTNNVYDNQQIEEEYSRVLTMIGRIATQGVGVQSLGQGVVQVRLGGTLKGLCDVIAAIGSLPYTYTISPEDAKWHVVAKTA